MRGAPTVPVLLLLVALAGGLAAAAGCNRGPSTVAAFPVDGLDGIIDRSEASVAFDEEESSDGRGSLMIESVKPCSVRLYEVAAPRNAGGHLIVLTAKMKSVGVRGFAYPELWIHFPDGRDIQSSAPLKGLARSRQWTELRAQYRCDRGEKPDKLRIDAVIRGIGKAWIDDVKITLEPLK